MAEEKLYQPRVISRDTIGYLVALGAVVSMLLSTILWFLKLDARYETLTNQNAVFESRLIKIEVKVDSGILPVAEERIEAVHRSGEALNKKLDNFIDWHGKTFVPAAGLQRDLDRLERRLKEIDDENNRTKK